MSQSMSVTNESQRNASQRKASQRKSLRLVEDAPLIREFAKEMSRDTCWQNKKKKIYFSLLNQVWKTMTKFKLVVRSARLQGLSPHLPFHVSATIQSFQRTYFLSPHHPFQCDILEMS